MEYVKKAGFDFTKEELESCLPSELSDEELARVAAGGKWCIADRCKQCVAGDWQ